MKMLCCHDEIGRITNMIFEPIPEGFAQHYDKLGLSYSMFDNPDDHDGIRIANTHYVADGKVVMRPDNDSTVVLDGRIVTINDVPDGSTVRVILNKETNFEYREIITDYILEFDEPGTLEIHITSPWPMLEAIYHVEIQ